MRKHDISANPSTFWKIFGWQRYDMRSADSPIVHTLWLRGIELIQVPESLIDQMKSESDTTLIVTLDIH